MLQQSTHLDKSTFEHVDRFARVASNFLVNKRIERQIQISSRFVIVDLYYLVFMQFDSSSNRSLLSTRVLVLYSVTLVLSKSLP